jgi:hypothetical protein
MLLSIKIILAPASGDSHYLFCRQVAISGSLSERMCNHALASRLHAPFLFRFYESGVTAANDKIDLGAGKDA